jgi:hypothetical protein
MADFLPVEKSNGGEENEKRGGEFEPVDEHGQG